MALILTPATRRELAEMTVEELVELAEAVTDHLYARVRDEYADECVENVNGIRDDLAALAKRTGWGA